MKSKYVGMVAAAFLAFSSASSVAVSGLSISVHGENAVLSWPSQEGETYSVQYRTTLDTNTPWVTLTNDLHAALGTNYTTFVHSNCVQYPAGFQDGGSGTGSPLLPASTTQFATDSSLTTAEQRAARRKDYARRAQAALEAMTAQLWAAVAKAKADRQKWISEGRPLRQPLAATTASLTSSQAITNTGFYRVVRTGIFFAGITNGSVLSGWVTLPVEVALTNGESLDCLYATSGSNSALSVGVQGLEFSEVDSGQPSASWDTTQVPNGVLQVNLGGVVNGGVDVQGASVFLLISNQIWFPDPYNWAGYLIEVQAQSVYSNGIYHVDLYDDTGSMVLELDGSTDAQGYITYGGLRGVIIQNYDDLTYEQYPSKYYRVAVATGPGGGSLAAGTVTTKTNFVWVERPWPATTPWNLYTEFSIGYQPIYGDPALGGTSAVTLESMIQTVYTAAEARAGGLGVFGSDSQNPFELWTQLNFSRLLLDLRHDEVRNLYYFGHGTPKYIGQKSPLRYLDMSDFYFMLNTRGDPLQPSTLTNPHPFRLVFLDGCSTADGDLCKAFGIPKITNMPATQFSNKGLRYRAFLGWNGKQNIGFGGTVLNTSHTEFIGHLFENWLIPDDYGNPRTIRQAISAAPAWIQKQYLIIYGYEGLLFEDTLP